jgi:hypothetical protein
MPQGHKLLENGFVDMLSLAAVLFLITTIMAVTSTVTNRNASLNFQGEAYFTTPPTKQTFIKCSAIDNNAGSINTCTGASENACIVNAKVCKPIYTAPAPSSTPTSTQIPIKTPNLFSLGNYCSSDGQCDSGICGKAKLSVKQKTCLDFRPIYSSPSPPPTAGNCSTSMQSLCAGWGADGCSTPKGGVETCIKGGTYYYSQLDTRWSGTVLTCDGGVTDTFGDRGCGQTTVAMLMSTYVDPSYTPTQVNNEFYGSGNCRGTGYVQNSEILKAEGFVVEQVSTTVEALKTDYIPNGWDVLVYVQYSGNLAHHLLITGVDSSNNFIVNDPYYGAGSLKSGNYPYNESNITAFYIVKPPGI